MIAALLQCEGADSVKTHTHTRTEVLSRLQSPNELTEVK